MAEDRSKADLAEDRTHYAEDRTLLANERTFAGWMRTGLASIGVGVAFHALFGKIEPGWLPRGIASLFIVAGMAIVFLAQRKGRAVQRRLETHDIKPVLGMNMWLIAAMMMLGAIALLAGIWMMPAA